MTEAVVLDEYPPYLMAHLTLPPLPGTTTADLGGTRSRNTLTNPNGASDAAVGLSWRQIRWRSVANTALRIWRFCANLALT